MTDHTKGKIAVTVGVVCACAIMGSCAYECFRAAPVIAGHDRAFSACMAESTVAVPHWRAAQHCFKRVPYSRRGQDVVRGYGLPSAIPRGKVPAP